MVGGLGIVLVWRFALDRMLYVLAAMFAGWGVLLLRQQRIARLRARWAR